MNGFISFVLAFFTFFASIVNTFTPVKVPEDKTDFTPVIRFMVASDTHVGSAGDILCMRVNKALKLSYAIAEADKEYNNLDAVVFCGDVTDNGRRDQFCGFQSTINSALRDGTQYIALLAKSHDGSTLDKGSLEYFKSISGLENDIHTVINGYHFITLSASKTPGEHYSEYQREWLKAQLDAAVKDDPSKPIFVAHHEHVEDTVYGSRDVDGWGIDYFRDIFNQYPQIVHFSGHSHYPVNDPRSIWQGEFTAVGTGAIKYLEFTVDSERKIHPSGYKQESEFWIVEVDANNRIRLRAYDLMEQKMLTEYIIDGPLSRDFTPEKQEAKSSAPVFTSDKVKVSHPFGSYKVKVDRADSTDGMPVVLYRAYVLDKDGNELGMSWKMPKYYSYTLDDNETIKIGKLPDGAASIKVVAENAYGMQSEPLKVTL
ncbi:MAG: metallophosphoesterase [Clostridia bacterium]|nr:metallophosphoesterase [Clostridia bacterium]